MCHFSQKFAHFMPLFEWKRVVFVHAVLQIIQYSIFLMSTQVLLNSPNKNPALSYCMAKMKKCSRGLKETINLDRNIN